MAEALQCMLFVCLLVDGLSGPPEGAAFFEVSYSLAISQKSVHTEYKYFLCYI